MNDEVKEVNFTIDLDNEIYVKFAELYAMIECLKRRICVLESMLLNK